MKKQWLLPVLLVLLALAPAASAAEAPNALGQLFEQIVALLAGTSSEGGVEYLPGGLASEIEKDPKGLGVEYPPHGVTSPSNGGIQYPPNGFNFSWPAVGAWRSVSPSWLRRLPRLPPPGRTLLLERLNSSRQLFESQDVEVAQSYESREICSFVALEIHQKK